MHEKRVRQATADKKGGHALQAHTVQFGQLLSLDPTFSMQSVDIDAEQVLDGAARAQRLKQAMGVCRQCMRDIDLVKQ